MKENAVSFLFMQTFSKIIEHKQIRFENVIFNFKLLREYKTQIHFETEKVTTKNQIVVQMLFCRYNRGEAWLKKVYEITSVETQTSFFSFKAVLNFVFR